MSTYSINEDLIRLLKDPTFIVIDRQRKVVGSQLHFTTTGRTISGAWVEIKAMKYCAQNDAGDIYSVCISAEDSLPETFCGAAFRGLFMFLWSEYFRDKNAEQMKRYNNFMKRVRNE